MDTFDDVIVGAGQAGPFLAVKLAARGRRVAVVERRALGGTCVNDGCIPTKAMVASARAAWVARNAARWGVVLGEVAVDLRAVVARKDAIVTESCQSLETWLGGTANLELVRGHARFVDAHTLAVGERRLRATRVFLNTGARPFVPPIPGLADVPHLTSESIMDLDRLPAHLIVLGGSYVGLEFAQMFRRFGSRVTVIERAGRLVPREDADVSAALAEILAGEGIALRVGAEARAVAAAPEGLAVTISDASGGATITGSHLLIAIGRVPNSHDLGLDAAGVDVDPRGHVITDDRLVTSQPHVWALGDVNGRGGFTHTSYDDFQIVAANLLDGADRRVTARIPIFALYTDPPLGRCGITAAEARASGRPTLIGRRAMSRVGRARERGETAGMMQILVDAETRRIVGASILGIEGDEAIHGIVDTMYADAPYDVLMRAVHAHPTVSELIPTMLEGLAPL